MLLETRVTCQTAGLNSIAASAQRRRDANEGNVRHNEAADGFFSLYFKCSLAVPRRRPARLLLTRQLRFYDTPNGVDLGVSATAQRGLSSTAGFQQGDRATVK